MRAAGPGHVPRMTTEDTRKVAELIKDQRLAMLTTRDPFGTLMSRPMALQEVEFDGDLWFFAERGSRKVLHVGASPQVNVTVSGSGSVRCGPVRISVPSGRQVRHRPSGRRSTRNPWWTFVWCRSHSSAEFSRHVSPPSAQ